MSRRVVISGIGAVTPIGHRHSGFWNGVSRGTCGIKTIDRFDTTGIGARVAAQVDDFDPLDYFDAKLARRMDRFAQMALAAADMAVEDAGLEIDRKRLNPRAGVTMGTALGGVSGAERQHERYMTQGLRSVDPSLALVVFGGAGSSNIAIRYGFTGPSNANSNSCASGAIAVGEAFRYIKEGYADVMIAAAAEAPLYPLTFGAFALIKALTFNPDPETACRPFDLRRDGFVMGEASAALVLEELSQALKRDAHIWCEVLGYSCNNDAYHMVAPRPDAASTTRVMRDTLTQGSVKPQDIGYINAHASSTPLNDKIETFAIKQVFGDRAGNIPISGTKSMHAHPLGATGALEAAICSMIFEKELLPPTIHYATPDPECDLDYVPNQARSQRVDYILSNSFGFGGINSSLLFGRHEG
ncbi:MAG: beta-ketoacyl-ACP synthase II [Ignavibacteriales bacterium]|nr:beta-ketoacyl-ACP synthase II [Ignavibacteriales bacterium]